MHGYLGVRQVCLHESTSPDQIEFHFYDEHGKSLSYGRKIPRGAALIVGEVER